MSSMRISGLLRYVLILISVLLLLPGCTKNEEAKKVSLTRQKPAEPQVEMELPPQDAFRFGFDLRLGPKEDVRIYLPLLKYLENTTGRRFRIKFSEKYEDTIEDLGRGITQFAAVGTLSYVIAESRYGIKYLVSGVNSEGDTTYHSIIFTSPHSPIRNINDLQGKCFAFGPRISTQGHLIPRKMLEDEGITLNVLGKHIYTGSHLDTVKAVLNGECDAGAVQDTLARKLEAEGKIKILKISGPYPSSLIAYNTSVDPKTADAVKAALIALEPAGRHKDILADWDKTEMPMGFTPVNEPEMEKIKMLAKKYGLLN